MLWALFCRHKNVHLGVKGNIGIQGTFIGNCVNDVLSKVYISFNDNRLNIIYYIFIMTSYRPAQRVDTLKGALNIRLHYITLMSIVDVIQVGAFIQSTVAYEDDLLQLAQYEIWCYHWSDRFLRSKVSEQWNRKRLPLTLLPPGAQPVLPGRCQSHQHVSGVVGMRNQMHRSGCGHLVMF